MNKFSISSIILILLLISTIKTNAQMNINGSFNVIGEVGVLGDLQLGADAQVFFQNGSTINLSHKYFD